MVVAERGGCQCGQKGHVSWSISQDLKRTTVCVPLPGTKINSVSQFSLSHMLRCGAVRKCLVKVINGRWLHSDKLHTQCRSGHRTLPGSLEHTFTVHFSFSVSDTAIYFGSFSSETCLAHWCFTRTFSVTHWNIRQTYRRRIYQSNTVMC